MMFSDIVLFGDIHTISLPIQDYRQYNQSEEFVYDHSAPVWSVAISPDGLKIASGSRDKTVKIWNLSTGQRLHIPMGHSDSVYSVAFSPDGQTLASGSYDKTIKIWHLGMEQLVHVLKGHSNSVYSLAFSSDGQTLASGSHDKTIKLWRHSRGKQLATLTEDNSYMAYTWSVVFSPDGQTLASSGGNKTIKRHCCINSAR